VEGVQYPCDSSVRNHLAKGPAAILKPSIYPTAETFRSLGQEPVTGRFDNHGSVCEPPATNPTYLPCSQKRYPCFGHNGAFTKRSCSHGERESCGSFAAPCCSASRMAWLQNHVIGAVSWVMVAA
jgi:hypothetical protein